MQNPIRLYHEIPDDSPPCVLAGLRYIAGQADAIPSEGVPADLADHARFVEALGRVPGAMYSRAAETAAAFVAHLDAMAPADEATVPWSGERRTKHAAIAELDRVQGEDFAWTVAACVRRGNLAPVLP